MRVRDCTLAILTAGASAPPGALSLLPFAALASAALGRGGEALRGGEILRARPGVLAMDSPSPCPPRRRHTADWQGRPATCTAAATLALRLPSAGAGDGIVAADAIVTSDTAAPSSTSMRVLWRITVHGRPGFIMVAAPQCGSLRALAPLTPSDAKRLAGSTVHARQIPLADLLPASCSRPPAFWPVWSPPANTSAVSRLEVGA